MSGKQLGVAALGLILFKQALQGAQQFLRRSRLIRNVQLHGGELFQVPNIGATPPAFKQNRGFLARLSMQFFYELHDQGDPGAVQRLQRGQVADLVGDPRLVD
jgi:hypothetical protein